MDSLVAGAILLKFCRIDNHRVQMVIAGREYKVFLRNPARGVTKFRTKSNHTRSTNLIKIEVPSDLDTWSETASRVNACGSDLTEKLDGDLSGNLLHCPLNLFGSLGQPIGIDIDSDVTIRASHVFVVFEPPYCLLEIVPTIRTLELDLVRINVSHQGMLRALFPFTPPGERRQPSTLDQNLQWLIDVAYHCFPAESTVIYRYRKIYLTERLVFLRSLHRSGPASPY
jgi:hypothetical protein